MIFQAPLVEATLLKRYKRFLADVRLPSGEVIVAHVPNSGSMLGVSDPESPCRLSLSPNLSRKLPYTLEMVFTRENQWVGTNTALTNHLVQEAFEMKKVDDWNRYTTFKREVKISAESRLDFLLSADVGVSSARDRYVEVKNVSMARPPCAVFPDAKTERGQKHLRDLFKLGDAGFETELFFVVQREDCETFSPCQEIDPTYANLLREVASRVTIRAWACKLTAQSIELDHALRVVL